MSALDTLGEQNFEQLSVRRLDGGFASIVAVHDTTLGPALGGVRIRKYATDDLAAADALRLARAMTFKAALAGLPLGGGKSVINADPRDDKTVEMLEAHGRHVAAFDGRYIPGADMGTGPADLEVIGRHAPRVSSDGRDPSPYTARGVVVSMETVANRLGSNGIGHKGLDGLRVAVQGIGNVGRGIVELLTARGARVVVADPDPERVASAVTDHGATATALDTVLLSDVDVVCPAGPGLVVTEEVAGRLRASAVVGAANNMFAGPGVGATLAARGVAYVPDFVSNAGGLISCAAEINGEVDFVDRVDRIGVVVDEILHNAAVTRSDPESAAMALAHRRIDAARQGVSG
ncbi:Glu/Leu/Phe/Val dehydrogenase dimerization domain-containing protein [Rhodococcus sp. Q]|uniref:Glu/Leu/Phe/Val dehydrogenase dimerization domain-containing protein n=1 Tax=Rhodococcus sp. Q TaxID=2502252 RepID=UPI002015FBCC|nr:Glu/Leu/Phe/Val dehydrogenase dimerization domain-containing protein [Rhodococcus sp. Q]